MFAGLVHHIQPCLDREIKGKKNRCNARARSSCRVEHLELALTGIIVAHRAALGGAHLMESDSDIPYSITINSAAGFAGFRSQYDGLRIPSDSVRGETEVRL